MKVCYLVLEHAEPERLGALLEALSHPDSAAIVHVDVRADLDAFRHAAPSDTLWLEDRIVGYHLGWAIVEATIRLLRAAPVVDYYVLLSGDSYPLRTQGQIHRYLSSRGGSEWMSLLPLPAQQVRKPITRLTRYYFHHDPRRSRLEWFAGKVAHRIAPRRDYRAALGNLEPWCGSQWWTLSRSAVEQVLRTMDERPDFVRFCQHTATPDEHFFHIILGSDPEFRARALPSLMYADFDVSPAPGPLVPRHVGELLATDLSFESPYGFHEELLFGRKLRDRAMASMIRDHLWTYEASIGDMPDRLASSPTRSKSS